MKRSEFEKIVTDLELEIEIGNSFNVVAQIWIPWRRRDNRIYLNGEYILTEVLTLQEINDINEKFKKIITLCDKNKLTVRDIHSMESGLISEIIVIIRKDTLMQSEKQLDFELEPTKLTGQKIPEIPVADYSKNVTVSDTLSGKLTSGELERFKKNIPEYIKAFNMDDLAIRIVNIAINTSINILEDSINNGIDASALINSILKIERSYTSPNEFKKIFAILSEYECHDIELTNKNRWYLPVWLNETKKTINNIFKNWEFTADAKERIIVEAINNEQMNVTLAALSNTSPFVLPPKTINDFRFLVIEFN